jgi:hypothetical protein
MAHYYLVQSGVEATLDVTLMSSVYVLRDASSGTLQFRFATV